MHKISCIRAVIGFVGLLVLSCNLQADTDLQGLLPEMITIPAGQFEICLLYTSPSPRDAHESRMPSSA